MAARQKPGTKAPRAWRLPPRLDYGTLPIARSLALRNRAPSRARRHRKPYPPRHYDSSVPNQPPATLSAGRSGKKREWELRSRAARGIAKRSSSAQTLPRAGEKRMEAGREGQLLSRRRRLRPDLPLEAGGRPAMVVMDGDGVAIARPTPARPANERTRAGSCEPASLSRHQPEQARDGCSAR